MIKQRGTQRFVSGPSLAGALLTRCSWAGAAVLASQIKGKTKLRFLPLKSYVASFTAEDSANPTVLAAFQLDLVYRWQKSFSPQQLSGTWGFSLLL